MQSRGRLPSRPLLVFLLSSGGSSLFCFPPQSSNGGTTSLLANGTLFFHCRNGANDWLARRKRDLCLYVALGTMFIAPPFDRKPMHHRIEY